MISTNDSLNKINSKYVFTRAIHSHGLAVTFRIMIHYEPLVGNQHQPLGWLINYYGIPFFMFYLFLSKINNLANKLVYFVKFLVLRSDLN